MTIQTEQELLQACQCFEVQGLLEGKFDYGPSVVFAGLKFGMYSNVGSGNCLGLPGSRSQEDIDVSHYSELQIDFLQHYYCYPEASQCVIAGYNAMCLALTKGHHSVLQSSCPPARKTSHFWEEEVCKPSCVEWANVTGPFFAHLLVAKHILLHYWSTHARVLRP